MNANYSILELILYFFLYGFLGWAIQVAYTAVKDGKYVNRGLLSLPVSVSFGLTEVVLLLTLTPLDGHPVIQFFGTWAIMEILHKLVDQFVRNISRRPVMAELDREELSTLTRVLVHMTMALVYLVVYLLLHPFTFAFVEWMPDWVITVTAIVISVLMVVDYISVYYTLRTKRVHAKTEERAERTQRMADRMTKHIWMRLEKAYPGVESSEPEERNRYVFARGICFDKLVWVFLVSSFLGALIEMGYCYAMGAGWMNRSSLLYGSFSVVWGFGAVVLTVVLQRFTGKEDRKVFLAGAAIGGAYEYVCSVFTELVFGTVFWDYSEMPLNIGGRTNVLYCIFWGILAVLWIKVLYPPMDRYIEKIPPLPGKIITWVLIVVMLCDALLTGGAMYRYTQRQTDPEPDNFVEAFLDESFDDDLMEKRWPNMKITEQP